MLSAYKKITSLSDRLAGPNKLRSGDNASYSDLDKRGQPNVFQAAAIIADTLKDVTETTANLLGVRSPYYIIGEVPADENRQVRSIWSNYDKAAYGVYRAVTNVVKNWSNKQEGVIIDSLGEITATMSVEFTSKPLFFVTSDTIDSRMRKPTIIKSTVAVSNYMADDAVGAAANKLAEYDPTGAADLVRDNLLYGGNTRAQYALYKLRWLMENSIPFIVYTPHGYYENMLIESISPRTDANNLDMLLCEITYKEAILSTPYFSNVTEYGKDLQGITPSKTLVEPKQGFASHFTLEG